MGFTQDLRFALRTLFKNKIVAIVAIASLALIVASNTIVFSVFNSLLIRPLEFDPDERLVLTWRKERARAFDRRQLSVADFNEYRTRNRVFEDMAGYRSGQHNLTGVGDPEELAAARVSPSFFRLVEVSLAHGRNFTDEEGLGDDPVAILSYEFFDRRFAGDTSIVGQAIELDRRPYNVVGVLEKGFEFLEDRIDVWLPLRTDAASTDRETPAILPAIGKLRPGVTPLQAWKDLDAIAKDLEQRYPEVNRGIGLDLNTFRDIVPGTDNEIIIKMIQGAGIFLLLIACSNLASLLMAQGQTRQRELAMRSAVGASRFRIVRQLLTESVVLAVVGGTIGIALGFVGVDLVKNAMAGDVPRLYLPVVDYRVLFFSLCISVMAGILFGTIPAVRSTGGALLDTLKEGGIAPAARSWVRRALVVAQMSLALVLLSGIGLLLKSFAEVQYADPGFDDERLLTFQLTLSEQDYDTPEKARAFLDNLLPEIKALSGVENATIVSALPRTYQNLRVEVEIVDKPTTEGMPKPQVTSLTVTPGYFDMMSISLLRGQGFTLADNAEAAQVAVVDRLFADRFWPGEDPLGQRIVLRGKERTVIGLASKVLQRRLGDFDGPLNALVYVPWAQDAVRTARFMVRSRNDDPAQLAEPIRRKVLELDSNLPVSQVRTYDEVVESVYIVLKVFGRLIAGFGIFAILLAALGVYGVLAYSVSQRTREIGVRVAMGASRGRVLAMVLREGIRLAAIGLVIGLPFVYGVRQLLESIVEGMASGWLVFIPFVIAGLVAVILVASLAPARRAARLSPVDALRFE